MTRQRSIAVSVIGSIALASASWIVGGNVQSAREAAARAEAPDPSIISAPIERRELVATTVRRGDANPGFTTSVRSPSSVEGPGVLTGFSMKPGDRVAEGERVAEVSGRPIFVLVGSVPSYRSLEPGSTGGDVDALRSALDRLGFDVGNEANYGPRTREAVARFYASAGYDALPSDPNQASELAATRARVVAARASLRIAERERANLARGPSESELQAARFGVASSQRDVDAAVAEAERNVRAARRALEDAQVAYDEAQFRPGATQTEIQAARSARDTAAEEVVAAEESGRRLVAGANDALALARTQLAELEAPVDLSQADEAIAIARSELETATNALAEQSEAAGATVPLGEVVFVPAAPVTIGSISDPPDDGGVLFELNAGGLQISLTVETNDLPSVRVGQAVEVINEQSAERAVGSVSEVADSAILIEGGGTGHAVTIVADGDAFPLSWAGVNLRLTFTTARSDGPVIAVPASAVSTMRDGSTAIQLLEPNDKVRDVVVRTGLSVDGMVEVESVGSYELKPGDRVVIGVR